MEVVVRSGRLSSVNSVVNLVAAGEEMSANFYCRTIQLVVDRNDSEGGSHLEN